VAPPGWENAVGDQTSEGSAGGSCFGKCQGCGDVRVDTLEGSLSLGEDITGSKGSEMGGGVEYLGIESTGASALVGGPTVRRFHANPMGATAPPLDKTPGGG
jgi:hypothetical protein